jgi:hypothetical protein
MDDGNWLKSTIVYYLASHQPFHHSIHLMVKIAIKLSRDGSVMVHHDGNLTTLFSL